MLITDRERYLMREAMKVGDTYANLDQWLDEIISDAGHTVEQHLDFDASTHARLINSDNDN